jgi:signal transduction histidine kinase
MVGSDNALDWTGRLVRLLVVFRSLVLFVTLLDISARQRTFDVGLAVVVAAVLSYVVLRHWDRVGPTLSRHPAYLAVEVVVATFVLAAAGVRSPFFYYTLGTAALAGIVYGRRGAIPFSALLVCAYEFVALEGFPSLHADYGPGTTLLAPLLYPVAIGCGIVARDLVQRGAQSELALRERTQALGAEQERLRVARELHDSLAKTVEGLAMSASMLPARCVRNPALAARQAQMLAEDARQAALEARMLMADLRPQTADDQSLQTALEVRVAAFAERAGVDVAIDGPATAIGDQLQPGEVHEVLRIVSEALTNAATHGGARRIRLLIDDDPDGMAITVSDDGDGLSEPVDLDGLKAAGHFGLAGMDERARGLGGELVVEPSPQGGTAVTVRLPPEAEELAADPRRSVGRSSERRRRWWGRRRPVSGVVAAAPAPPPLERHL